jgi:flagellar biosynthesis/type III secretory pathway chaperone
MSDLYSSPRQPRPAPSGGALRSPSGSASPRSGADTGEASFAAIHQMLHRLEEVVQQETEALQSRRVVNLEAYNTRKSQCLLELTRALRLIEAVEPGGALRERMSRLRGLLEANRAILKMHLDAAQEVATIIADAMREAESDGTYSPSIRGRGGSL